jgi:hypothetical protein
MFVEFQITDEVKILCAANQDHPLRNGETTRRMLFLATLHSSSSTLSETRLQVGIFLASLLLARASAFAEPSATPAERRKLAVSPTVYATFPASSRYWVDFHNLTFALSSDESLASIGAADDYSDGIGSLKATAVLVLTGFNANNPLPFTITRCDFLLFKKPFTTFVGITTFQLTLFSDDHPTDPDFPTHNPYQQVRPTALRARKECALATRQCVSCMLVPLFHMRVSAPLLSSLTQLGDAILLSSQTTPLLTYRANWYQQDVTGARWPQLNQSTYYWVVLSPTTTMPITNQVAITGPKFNGALWSGIDSAKYPTKLPPLTQRDPHVYTARVLRTQRQAGDATYGCTTRPALGWLKGALNASNINGWVDYTGNGSRLLNWEADPAGARIVYGVSLLGYQEFSTQSATASSTSTSSRTSSGGHIHRRCVCVCVCVCVCYIAAGSAFLRCTLRLRRIMPLPQRRPPPSCRMCPFSAFCAATMTSSRTGTASSSSTRTQTATPSSTATGTGTATSSLTQSATRSSSSTSTSTNSATSTRSATSTPSSSSSSTQTSTQTVRDSAGCGLGSGDDFRLSGL